MAETVLIDVLAPGLDVVFCGTAAGHESAAKKMYYANRTNLFWPTLHDVGLTPRRFEPAEFQTLLDLKIGLTDIAKFDKGNDKDLKPGSLGDKALQDLRARILKYQPRILAFTSLTGGRAFLRDPERGPGPQPERVGATKIWLLPSTSFHGRKWWDVGIWHDLVKEIRAFEGVVDA